MGKTFDKLREAGISYGLKPLGAEALAAGPILAASGLTARSACLLQAWLGGAHDAHDTQFAFTAYGLSAQAACGIDNPWFVWSLPSIADALNELRDLDNKAADLVESAGKAKAKASAKKQNTEAEADAEKLRQQALSAVSVGAIGIGTVVAVAAVAYLVFMASTAKGK